jgi:hypothetical protein
LARERKWDLFADRQLHRRDLLHLADDDFLRDAPKLFVLAVAQFEHGHVDRALMVRRHHGDEVAVDVAGRLCLHRAHHPGHRGLVFGEEGAFVRVAALLRRLMSFCANANARGGAAKATRRRMPKTAAPRPGLRNRSIVAVPSGFEFECFANSVHGVVTRGGAFYSVVGDAFLHAIRYT